MRTGALIFCHATPAAQVYQQWQTQQAVAVQEERSRKLSISAETVRTPRCGVVQGRRLGLEISVSTSGSEEDPLIRFKECRRHF